MQQKPFHGNTLGRDGGEINLGAFLLVQQDGPVMVIHADDVILHNGAHETEENLTIWCVLHFVRIEPLPAFALKLQDLKLPQLGQRQGVNASMDEGIHAACKIRRMNFLGACKTRNTDEHEKEELLVECTFHVGKIGEDST